MLGTLRESGLTRTAGGVSILPKLKHFVFNQIGYVNGQMPCKISDNRILEARLLTSRKISVIRELL